MNGVCDNVRNHMCRNGSLQPITPEENAGNQPEKGISEGDVRDDCQGNATHSGNNGRNVGYSEQQCAYPNAEPNHGAGWSPFFSLKNAPS